MSEQPKIVSIPEVELDAKDARIAELEAEVARLREALTTAKWDISGWKIGNIHLTPFWREATARIDAALAAPPDQPKEPSE